MDDFGRDRPKVGLDGRSAACERAAGQRHSPPICPQRRRRYHPFGSDFRTYQQHGAVARLPQGSKGEMEEVA